VKACHLPKRGGGRSWHSARSRVIARRCATNVGRAGSTTCARTCATQSEGCAAPWFHPTLFGFGADIVVSGHDHSYERFAPQNPDGLPDPARGLRQFVVGAGGAGLRSFPRSRLNSEARGSDWGVLVLSLDDGGYRWEFLPVEGATFRDSGSGVCH